MTLPWKRQDARLLAALACVPQTPVLYQVVPLFLLVNTVREGTLLVVLTALAGRIIAVAAAGTDYTRGWPSAANGWCGWCISRAP